MSTLHLRPCSHPHAHLAEVCLAGSMLAFGAIADAAPEGRASTLRAEAEVGPTPASISTEAPWTERFEGSAGGVVSVVTQVRGDGAELSLGQAEAALGFEVGVLSVEGVLAWDEDTMALGALVGTVRLAGAEAAIVPAGFALELSGGQIDVPIGLAYEQYAASDRPMVSEPLVVEGTHAAWNAYGAQLALTKGALEARVFGAQSFDSALDPAAAELDPNGAPGPAFGARTRVRLGHFSVGGSGAVLFDNAVHMTAGLAEVDATFAYADFEARAEAIALVRGGAETRQLVTGGYLMLTQGVGPFGFAVRADLVNGEQALERRFALCAGWHVWEDYLQLRTEVSSDFGSEEEAVLLQAVAAL